MNLLTDDFPALGLGFEPSDPDVMKRPPRDPKSNPITKKTFAAIIIFGIIMGAGTLFMFSQYLDKGLNTARTVAFTTLVMFEMFAIISIRSLYHSWRKLNPLTNKWLMGGIILSIALQCMIIYFPPFQKAFETTALGFADILKILGISVFGFIMMEGGKYFVKIKEFESKNNKSN